MSELKPLPCPWCGCQPKIMLGKKVHCQLHGEPSQGIIIKCDWKDCPAKPLVEYGDIYNGIGDAIYKDKATKECIEKWNNRHAEISKIPSAEEIENIFWSEEKHLGFKPAYKTLAQATHDKLLEGK